MRRTRFGVLVLLATSFAFPTARSQVVASAPSTAKAGVMPAYRFRILGVYDAETTVGVQNAEVVNLSTGASETTNRSGLVRLDFLPDGGALVRIRKIGYEPITRFVTISPADTAPLTEVLSAATPRLPTVVTHDSSPKYISPGLRGFEQRRRLGIGHFITEAELRKKDDVGFNNVVAMFPGLMVSCHGQPTHCYAVSTRLVNAHGFSGTPCYISVYQDGVPMGPIDQRDLLRMHTYDFGAVEFYAGGAETPIEFNATGNSCGVLLLWTRER